MQVSRHRSRGGRSPSRRGSSGSWRRQRRDDRGARLAALSLVAAALVGVGFLLGRFTAPGAGPGATGDEAIATPAESAGDGRELATPGGAVPAAATADLPAGAGGVQAALDQPPLEPAPPAGPAAAGAGPVAIVIDDLGRSLDVIDRLRALAVPLTYAVLPYESRSAAVAQYLNELGEEVLCHLPMASHQANDPGPGALTAAMDGSEIREHTRLALAAVPGAAGVNNHMGSALSEDRTAMTAMLEVLRERGLYFLDSRTSPGSVAYAVARERGVPAAERKVFLDDERALPAIRHEFERLLALADRGEPAIAIGHPYEETLEVLQEQVPRARARGYRMVRVSDLLAR